MRFTVATAALLVALTACKAAPHPAQPLVEGTVTSARTWTKKTIQHYELTIRTPDRHLVKVRTGATTYERCRKRGSRVPACNTR